MENVENGNYVQEKLFKEKTGKSFEFVYRKYYPRLKSFILNIVKNVHESEDLSTEAFINSLNKIDTFDKDKAQYSTWLFTIGRNLAIQHVKKKYQIVSIDSYVDEDGTTIKDFLEYETDDTTELFDMHCKKSKMLLKEIKKLKEPYKTVIEMREIENLQYKEIADKLGRNLNSIKSQIRNGRKILIAKTKNEFKNLEKKFIE